MLIWHSIVAQMKQKLSYHELLKQMASQRKGVLSTRDVVKAGIPKPEFYSFLNTHGFENIGRGIYLSPDAWLDGMYVLSLRSWIILRSSPPES